MKLDLMHIECWPFKPTRMKKELKKKKVGYLSGTDSHPWHIHTRKEVTPCQGPVLLESDVVRSLRLAFIYCRLLRPCWEMARDQTRGSERSPLAYSSCMSRE